MYRPEMSKAFARTSVAQLDCGRGDVCRTNDLSSGKTSNNRGDTQHVTHRYTIWTVTTAAG